MLNKSLALHWPPHADITPAITFNKNVADLNDVCLLSQMLQKLIIAGSIGQLMVTESILSIANMV